MPLERLARQGARAPLDFQVLLDPTANKARKENLASRDYPVRQEKMENTVRWDHLVLKEKKESQDLRVLRGFEVALAHQDPKEMLDHLVSRDHKANQASKARRDFQEEMVKMANKERPVLPGNLVQLDPWGCLELMASQVPRVRQVSREQQAYQGRKVTEASLVQLALSAQQDHKDCLDHRDYLVSGVHLVLLEM